MLDPSESSTIKGVPRLHEFDVNPTISNEHVINFFFFFILVINSEIKRRLYYIIVCVDKMFVVLYIVEEGKFPFNMYFMVVESMSVTNTTIFNSQKPSSKVAH